MAKKGKKDNLNIPICHVCVASPSDKGLKNTDFYWVNKISKWDDDNIIEYGALYCIKCIEKHNLVIKNPYQENKKRGRPKKVK